MLKFNLKNKFVIFILIIASVYLILYLISFLVPVKAKVQISKTIQKDKNLETQDKSRQNYIVTPIQTPNFKIIKDEIFYIKDQKLLKYNFVNYKEDEVLQIPNLSIENEIANFLYENEKLFLISDTKLYLINLQGKTEKELSINTNEILINLGFIEASNATAIQQIDNQNQIYINTIESENNKTHIYFIDKNTLEIKNTLNTQYLLNVQSIKYQENSYLIEGQSHDPEIETYKFSMITNDFKNIKFQKVVPNANSENTVKTDNATNQNNIENTQNENLEKLDNFLYNLQPFYNETFKKTIIPFFMSDKNNLCLFVVE